MKELLTIFILASAGQGIFLASLLVCSNNNNLSNKFYSIFLFLFSFELINFYLYFSNNHFNFYLELLVDSFGFAYGPLLYMYTKHITKIRMKLIKEIRHFIPLFAIILYNSLFFMINKDQQTNIIQRYMQGDFPADYHITSIIMYSINLFYLFRILMIIAGNSNKIKNYYSSISKVNLSWLKSLLIAVFFVWLSGLFINLAYFTQIYFPVSPDRFYIIFIFSSALVFYISGYFALKQPEIFKLNTASSAASENQKKYVTSSLDNTQIEELHIKLNQYLETSKIFLEPELNIKTLSEKINIPAHHISQIVNTVENSNFFNWINKFRILEAQKMLQDKDYQDYTILRIAYESGFNSKSTFNSIFKKFTNITPSDYRSNNNYSQ